jgi:hypothetical protein
MENKAKTKLYTIYINCSDVAAAVGMNRYKSPEEIARNILFQQFNNISNDSINNIIGEEKTKKYDIVDKTKEILVTNHEEKIVELAHQKMSSISHEVEQKIELDSKILSVQITKEMMGQVTKLSTNETEHINSDIEKITQTIVEEVVHKSISMKTGIIAEKNIVDSVEKSIGETVEDRNCTIKYRDISLPSSLYTENKKWRIRIGGKPDGIIYGDNIQIVEVKNRQNRLFCSVPIYEYVQVQLYLWIFKAHKCQFREQYHCQYWNTIIDFNPTMIDDIQKKLINFAKEYILTSVN